ncbi:hypothetical protein ACFU6S_34885 [Streptomyces sp. NPDC057456]|uniref:hypothetical protein n=1 Tax=Streptomyces sp. NPDC057456 TaxID=3346139 RepID=UPI0036C7DA3F
MPALTADRSPDQLVAELERLIGVDWPTVWAGAPEDTEKRARWCAGFDWRPLWSEAGLRVRTALGGRLYLASAAPGGPVTRIDHTVWSARARNTDENALVTDLAEARWTASLTALRTLLGNPAWHGAWDTPGFPELPGRGSWYSPQWRLEHHDPYRTAVWRYRTPGAPVIELKTTLGTGSNPSAPADARIELSCHGPSAAR